MSANVGQDQLIFEHSRTGRTNGTQMVDDVTTAPEIPEDLLRKTPPMLPESI